MHQILCYISQIFPGAIPQTPNNLGLCSRSWGREGREQTTEAYGDRNEMESEGYEGMRQRREKGRYGEWK